MTASLTPTPEPLAPASRWHAAALAAVLALVVVAFGWRGEDWPAQIYRAELFERQAQMLRSRIRPLAALMTQ